MSYCPFLNEPCRDHITNMADTITIPSPSVFLRASPDPVPGLDNSQQVVDDEQNKTAAAKKRNTTRKKSVASTAKPRRDGAAVAKPKQSKSRNGRLQPHHEY